MVSRVFQKDPGATLDYAVDWSLWLDGDSITSSAWTVPDGIERLSDTYNGPRATVWLRGGTAGSSYMVTNRITTTGGRTDERSIKIQVDER